MTKPSRLPLWIPILATLLAGPVRAQEPALHDLGSLLQEVTARYGAEEIQVDCPGFGEAGPGDPFSCEVAFASCAVKIALEMRAGGRFVETGREESEGCSTYRSGEEVDRTGEPIARFFEAYDRRAWGAMEAIMTAALRAELSPEFFAALDRDYRDVYGAVVSTEIRQRTERADGCRWVDVAAKQERADAEYRFLLCREEADWRLAAFEWRISHKDVIRHRLRDRYLKGDAPEVVASGCTKPAGAYPPHPLECVYVLEGGRCEITVQAMVEGEGGATVRFREIEWTRPCKRYRREGD